MDHHYLDKVLEIFVFLHGVQVAQSLGVVQAIPHVLWVDFGAELWENKNVGSSSNCEDEAGFGRVWGEFGLVWPGSGWLRSGSAELDRVRCGFG